MTYYQYKFLVTILLVIISLNLDGQVTKVRGKVIDAETKEPLPFVSVSYQNSTIGTITNTDGEFFIETQNPTDTLIVYFLGYKSQSKAIQKNRYQELYYELIPDIFELGEIIIRPKENPAHPILRNIIANKHKHNPSDLDYYSLELYNKIEASVNNVDDNFRKQRFLGDFKFIFDYVDTSAITGKTFLPVFISESFSDYYYSRNPSVEREIIKASRISGVDNISVSEYTGKKYQEINIYENYLMVFEPGFVSPISDYGFYYYKYYLIDSSYIDNKWCYRISFTPKRKQDRTFRGDFWVNDTSFAIKKIQLRTAKEINFNYINDFVAEYEYQLINDSIWFLSLEKLFFDFNIGDRITGFFVQKTTHYSNINLERKIPEEILKLNDNIIVSEGALNKDENFWEEHRPIPLTQKEKNIYLMVDSIKNVPIYKTFEKIVRMFFSYHYEIGLFEFGPYYQTFSFNEIEGNRLRLSNRTSKQFSTKLRINAYGAFGASDERFKYGGGVEYLFNNNPRSCISINAKYDMEQLGQSPLALTEDNIFKSILRRNPNNKITMVKEINTKFEKEWFRGFSNVFEFTHRRIEPAKDIPFQLPVNDNTIFFKDIKTSEFTLNIRIAKDEKYVRGEFDRLNLGTTKPVLNISLSAGLKDIFESQYEYYKIHVNFSHKVPVNPIGYFRYIVDAGQIFGTVPYPLLKLHEGNETYTFDRYAYNMMNYYEFASDRYLSVYAEHHFQGLIFNKLPLIRKLKFREVISVKGLIGELSDKHRQIIEYPESLHELKKPYLETSAGIENIFKIFRVDAVWRLSYLEHEKIEKFGLRITMQFIF